MAHKILTNINSIIKSIKRSKTNLSLFNNICNAFIYRGLGVVLGMLYIPLYLRYFNNNEVLGVWFTVINVLNWVMTLDLGIGNGLRNHLTIALSNGDKVEAKKLVSSAYLMLGGIIGIISVVFYVIADYIDWNGFFNVPETNISTGVLRSCIKITMFGILVSFFLRIVVSINFALQKASRNNLISLSTSFLIFVYLIIVPPGENCEIEFKNLSIYHALAANIPLVVATIFVFKHKLLKDARPSFKYYHASTAKKVLSLGILFLFLQILYMIISVTNEWFISKYYNPTYCVDYQIYFKIFSFSGTLILLALSPLWSAITKALAEKRYSWIIRTRKILNIAFIALVGAQIIIVLLLPWIFKIWLHSNDITVDYIVATWFLFYSIVFIWVAMQSTIVAGLGMLKVQLYCYIFAAAFKIITIITLSSLFTSWVFVIAVTVIGLLPYCIIQPISIRRQIKRLSSDNININSDELSN